MSLPMAGEGREGNALILVSAIHIWGLAGATDPLSAEVAFHHENHKCRYAMQSQESTQTQHHCSTKMQELRASLGAGTGCGVAGLDWVHGSAVCTEWENCHDGEGWGCADRAPVLPVTAGSAVTADSSQPEQRRPGKTGFY